MTSSKTLSALLFVVFATDSVAAAAISKQSIVRKTSLVEKEDSTMLDPQVQELVQQVESFAKSNERPDKPQQQVIMDMVKNDLIPGLEKERDFAKGEVDMSIDAFKKCNKQSGENQASVQSAGSSATDSNRQSHKQCRGQEKAHHESRKGRCGELDTFLSTVKPSPELPSGSGKEARRAKVEYVKEQNTYFCPMEPSTEQMANACEEAIQTHEGETAKCNTAQRTFETSFCIWRQQAIDTCSQATNCYKNAADNYEIVKTNTRNIVKKLKLEYSSLKKIECYVNVWLKDENTKTASSDQYATCNGSTIDASSMNIDLPDPPALVTCPLTSVKTYPGTESFETTEYGDLNGYAVAAIPCSAN